MADFDKIGLYNGPQPPNRCLARLDQEIRRVGRQATPEELFEAVEILFEDNAATWLDSNPRYRRIIDGRKDATGEDRAEFEEALSSEFSSKTTTILDERSLREEIGNFSQGCEESLKAYYRRAQELLRRSHA